MKRAADIDLGQSFQQDDAMITSRISKTLKTRQSDSARQQEGIFELGTPSVWLQSDDEYEISAIETSNRAKRDSSSKQRYALTKQQAIEIYKKRPQEMGFEKYRRGMMLSSEAVCVEYGVTSKTIRDIWRGRTWNDATGHPQTDIMNRSVQDHLC